MDISRKFESRSAHTYGLPLDSQNVTVDAISAENTGSLSRRFDIDYVQSVVSKSGQSILIPSLSTGEVVSAPSATIQTYKSKLNAWEESATIQKSVEQQTTIAKPSTTPLVVEGF